MDPSTKQPREKVQQVSQRQCWIFDGNILMLLLQPKGNIQFLLYSALQLLFYLLWGNFVWP